MWRCSACQNHVLLHDCEQFSARLIWRCKRGEPMAGVFDPVPQVTRVLALRH